MKALFLFLFCGMLCLTGCTKNDDIANGSAGALTWILREDGTLTISGKGEMPDYDYSESNYPWYEYRDDITKVVIGNDVSKIGNFAFSQLSNLASVTIGSSVSVIGNGAFQDCRRLTEIVNYQGSPQIISEHSAFGETFGTFGNLFKPQCTLWVPVGSVEAYRNDNEWKRFYKIGAIGDPGSIPAGIGGTEGPLKWALSDDGVLTIDGIGDMPFYNIYGTMHSNPTQPQWYWDSKSILHVIIEEGVTSISNYAFFGCGNIITISIPSTVISISSTTSFSCTAISVAADNPEFSSIDGVLFNKTKTALIKYPPRKQNKSYTIPDGVTMLNEYCAFSYCENLTSITIPNSVTIIEGSNFWFCSSLTEVINYQAIPQKISGIFSGVNKTACTLFVPAGSEAAYRAAEGWTDFVNIKAIQ